MTYFDHKALWILIAAMVVIPLSIGFVVALLKSNKNPFPCHAAKREPVEFGVGASVSDESGVGITGPVNRSRSDRPTHTLTLSSPQELI